MKDFNRALQHCLNAIDLGIDLESCLSIYPEYEEQLREFFRKWNGARDYLKAFPASNLEQLLFNQALDECIRAVGSGESPANCYRRYPAYAHKMRPWLEAVSDLPRLRKEGLLQTDTVFDELFTPEVPFTQALDEYIQAYRKNEQDVVLARYPYYSDRLQFWADKIPNPDRPELHLTSPKLVVAKRLLFRVGGLFSNPSLKVQVAASLTLLLFLFSGIGLARAAATTIPGDTLYPVKLIAEQIHLNISPEDQKANLKAQFAKERLQETSALIQADIKQEVAFDGEITSIDQNKVMVSNVVVLLNRSDSNLPVFAKGEHVHIEGYTGRNGVVVRRIDVHSSTGTNKTFVASTPYPSSLSNTLDRKPFSVAQESPTPFARSNTRSNFTFVTPTIAVDAPSDNPKTLPTSMSTNISTPVPTSMPTDVPPPAPTSVPTEAPTSAPTSVPTNVPPPAPTSVPTNVPPPAPTSVPTDVPPPAPTSAPTDALPPEPTSAPTDAPPPAPTTAPPDNPSPAPEFQSIATTVPTNSQP